MLLSALFSGADGGVAAAGLACFGAGFLAPLFLTLLLPVFFVLARLAAGADAPDLVRVVFLVAR
jgi:hypothetical protein